MSYKKINLNDLKSCSKNSSKLSVVERKVPLKAYKFFEKLRKRPFKVVGRVCKESTLNDIEVMLKNTMPCEIQNNPFYHFWLNDMAKICEVFCDIENSNAIGFCLGTERGCRRFHVDNVLQRLLVTYAGKGTEWLPESCADRDAYLSGAPNEKIVKENSESQFIDQWNVAVFRGGPHGLLHRTPDEALKTPSILMRLDHQSFWDTLIIAKE